MSTATILIVDDDAAHRSMLKTILRGWNYNTDDADDGTTAIEAVQNKPYDAVLMDVRMVRMDGMEALRHIRNHNPALPVIIMTAYSSVDTAVEALRQGAYDYLTKPLDFDVMRLAFSRALEHTRLVGENRSLKKQLATSATDQIIGKSPPMKALKTLVNTIAPSEATVLILGESGTGKELVAKAIHVGSHRKDAPLVTVNCAALSENLLESELFGHEKGAFTGADRRREGRFAQANKGTLFLDEIGELPLALQAKLLRALQQGEVQRVGSDIPIKVDVRIVAATNRNLAECVAADEFREDLYYRLNVIAVTLPPLHERQEDIPLLASHFLTILTEKNRKTLRGFTPRAMDVLLHYSWPGNVRELENVIERAVILAAGDWISERDLPLNLAPTATEKNEQNSLDTALGTLSLDELERQAIIVTLQQTEDNKSEAARRLGITRATLHNKLKRYGLEGNGE